MIQILTHSVLGKPHSDAESVGFLWYFVLNQCGILGTFENLLWLSRAAKLSKSVLQRLWMVADAGEVLTVEFPSVHKLQEIEIKSFLVILLHLPKNYNSLTFVKLYQSKMYQKKYLYTVLFFIIFF